MALGKVGTGRGGRNGAVRERCGWRACTSVLLLAVIGCVSTRLDRNRQDNSYYGEPPDAGADAATNVTSLPTAMTPLTPELRDQLMNSSCSTWYGEGQAAATVLDFVVDVSSSMAGVTASTGTLTKWEVTRSALRDAIAHLPQTTQLGLLLYPNRDTPANDTGTAKDATACIDSAAMIPVSLLGKSDSAQRKLVADRFTAAQPKGGTPTQDALGVALANLGPAVAGLSDVHANLILVTDGQPTISGGCRGPGNESTAVGYQPIIDLISSAWSEYGVRTFVIGAPGSDRDINTGADVRYWLSHAASAGQTSTTPDCSDTGLPNFCHYDLSQAPDFTASFERALQTITGLVLSCSFALPADAGQEVNTDALNVIYGVNDEQNTELLIARTDAHCMTEGWYLDSSNNVVFCPKTCEVIQQNPNAEIRILVGCQSVVIN
jgi:Mg-chelatase subunit ChlD